MKRIARNRNSRTSDFILLTLQNSENLPNKLRYSIRLLEERYSSWKTDQLYEISIEIIARDSDNGPYPMKPPYNPKCFLGIQNRIDRAFIKSISRKPLPDLKMQRFPYPSVVTDAFVVAAASAFPALFAFCLMFSAKTIIKASHNFFCLLFMEVCDIVVSIVEHHCRAGDTTEGDNENDGTVIDSTLVCVVLQKLGHVGNFHYRNDGIDVHSHNC